MLLLGEDDHPVGTAHAEPQRLKRGQVATTPRAVEQGKLEAPSHSMGFQCIYRKCLPPGSRAVNIGPPKGTPKRYSQPARPRACTLYHVAKEKRALRMQKAARGSGSSTWLWEKETNKRTPEWLVSLLS